MQHIFIHIGLKVVKQMKISQPRELFLKPRF